MLQKKLISGFLVLFFIIGTYNNILAGTNRYVYAQNTTESINKSNTVMPRDIVNALEKSYSLDSDTISSDKTSNDVLATVELQRSLSISIPKIDISKVHDTNPLEQLQIDNLIKHGYSKEQILTLDAGDYYEIEKTWKIPSEAISNIMLFFPDVDISVISEWTWEDYFAYSKSADAISNVYAPTKEQEVALNARNITLSDARMLLKDFQTYDNLLSQNDDTIKAYIESYYKFTIDNIKQLAQISEQRSATINYLNSYLEGTTLSSVPPVDLQGTTYRYVNFEGYQADWFHVDSMSWDATTRSAQKAAVLKGYNKLYNKTGTTFTCTNLWGTWSSSQNGAHEGIDYAYGTNPTIYSISSGTIYYYSATSTAGILGIYDGTNTNFYYHMNTINIRSNGALLGTVLNPSPEIKVGSGDSVGTQGMKGNASGNHVHYEVDSGRRTSGYGESDNTLSSANPYTSITTFIK